MTFEAIKLAFLILSCILSTLAILLSIVAIIKVIAMEKSTHTVQYMSADEWATSDQEIDKINKEFKEINEAEIDLFKGI